MANWKEYHEGVNPPPYRAFLPLPIVFGKKQGQDALKKAIPPAG